LIAHTLIDFDSGQHGHFLEYVISTYIFNQRPVPLSELFDAVGSCDGFNLDIEYRKNRTVRSGHFSFYYHTGEHPYPKVDQIIYIKQPDDLGHEFILMVNAFHKAGFVTNNFQDTTHEHISNVLEVTDLRTAWEDRLAVSFKSRQGGTSCSFPGEIYNFDYRTFFSLPKFMIELRRVAKFLNRSFQYDESLIVLWEDFIAQNQGYTLYSVADRLLNKIALGESDEIPNEWKIHAYLNVQLGRMYNVYECDLLNDPDSYPTDTKEVHDIIMKSVKEAIASTVY